MKPLFFPRFVSSFLLVLCGFFSFSALTGCTNENTPEENGSLTQQQTKNEQSQQLLPQYFQTLRLQPYVAEGSRKVKAVALTFDADMTPYMLKTLKTGKVKSSYDERIVRTLKKDGAPATIFMTGMWAETYPDIAQKLAADPNFEIENHSYDHAAFQVPCYNLALTQNAPEDVTKAQDAIRNITGVIPKYFRFPGGCFDDNALKTVHDLGLVPVQWDVISGDAYLKDPKNIIKQVVSQSQNGSIIVFHLNGAPNAPATADALPAIIEKLKAKGFSFMTLDGLLQASAKI